jgi:hypothetical protein
MTIDDGLDLEVPAGILRQLESVDVELARRTGSLGGSQGPSDLRLIPVRADVRVRHARRVRPSDTRPVLLAASMAISLLAALSFVALPRIPLGSSIAATPPIERSIEPTSAGAASVVPSSDPSAVPSASVESLVSVRVVRANTKAFVMLGKELRSGCVGKEFEPTKAPDKATVLAAAEQATGDAWLDTAHRVRLSASPQAAAAAFEAVVLVIGNDSQWIIPAHAASTARRLVALKTANGTVYWLGTSVTGIPCK